jgi:hypothetical protein
LGLDGGNRRRHLATSALRIIFETTERKAPTIRPVVNDGGTERRWTMRKATYEMLHDRFAHEFERRFEVLIAAAVAILTAYVVLYRPF